VIGRDATRRAGPLASADTLLQNDIVRHRRLYRQHASLCDLKTTDAYVNTDFSAPPPGRGAKYCDENVCLSVCLSASITRKRHGRTSPIFAHVARGRGSVLL